MAFSLIHRDKENTAIKLCVFRTQKERPDKVSINADKQQLDDAIYRTFSCFFCSFKYVVINSRRH